MNVCLPCSRRRRYLSGMDWIVATLGEMTRRAAGRRNAFQVVLELDRPIDARAFRAAFHSFTSGLPFLWGRPSRDWSLAPYWRNDRAPAGRTLRVEEAALPAGVPPCEVEAWLEGRVNLPEEAGAGAVCAHVLAVGSDRGVVAFDFDHRLFDARGAEMFIDLLQRHMAGEDCRDAMARVPLVVSAGLDNWRRRFLSGQIVNRFMIAMARDPHRVLPRRRDGMPGRMRFHAIHLDEAESAVIEKAAFAAGGYLMMTPHLLAAFTRAVHAAFDARGSRSPVYVASVSTDRRPPNGGASTLFFNHLSFLFFRVPADLATRGTDLVDVLKRQMYDQVRDGLPAALADACMLMRIVPVRWLGRLILAMMRGEFSSFGFTCLGDSGVGARRFAGARVTNLLHMPIMPVPPGLGLIVNRFGPRLNVVLTYIDGMLEDGDVSGIERTFRAAAAAGAEPAA
jgi:hypothetical protein